MNEQMKRSKASAEFLIALDLDGTCCGDVEGTRVLTRELERLRDRALLIYATGRTHTSASELIEDQGLPKADVLAASVGTQIVWGIEQLEDALWTRRIARGFERQLIVELFEGQPGLTMQPASEQSSVKLSYRLDPDVVDGVELEMMLAEEGLTARVVVSSRVNLDILPVGASKSSALEHIRASMGLQSQPIIAAGDSGNDEDMLVSSDFGIVVANHFPEVEHLRRCPSIYFANGGHGHGVVEGLGIWLSTRMKRPRSRTATAAR